MEYSWKIMLPENTNFERFYNSPQLFLVNPPLKYPLFLPTCRACFLAKVDRQARLYINLDNMIYSRITT